MIKEIRNIETNELRGYNFNGLFIPIDSSNRHYQEIQKLVREGKEIIEPAFTEEDRLNYFKNDRIKKLQTLADMKTKEVKNTLAGYAVSQEQAERYEIKYKKAVEAIANGDYSFFEPEAKLIGKDPETLANEVKEAGDAWNDEIAKQIALIEAYRVKAKSIILSITEVEKFKVIDKYLDLAKDLENITEDSLVEIFTNFENDLANFESSDTTGN